MEEVNQMEVSFLERNSGNDMFVLVLMRWYSVNFWPASVDWTRRGDLVLHGIPFTRSLTGFTHTEKTQKQ